MITVEYFFPAAVDYLPSAGSCYSENYAALFTRPHSREEGEVKVTIGTFALDVCMY